jgi:hypothetical protein
VARRRLGEGPDPAAAAHRDHQLNGVLKTLRLGADIAEPRLLILPLGVQEIEDAGAAPPGADARQALRLGRGVAR